jgi:predicted permease
VVSVAAGTAIPLNTPEIAFELPFETEPQERRGGRQEMRAEIRLVSPGYFRTLGISREKGRDFEARDGKGTPPVAIVNRELARLAWEGEDPLGKRLYLQYLDDESWEVVGVVGNVRHYALDEQPRAEIYLPLHRHPAFFSSVVVRTAGPAGAALEPVRAAVRDLDREQAVTFGTMEGNVDRALAERRFTMLLLIAFAGAATVLTLVGIHGVMARWVAQRQAEIGIRIALGARPGTILRTVMARGLALTGIGLLVGLGAALGTVRFLDGFLYRVSSGDLVTFILASALLSAASLLSCLVPAQVATRLDPVAALRSE